MYFQGDKLEERHRQSSCPDMQITQLAQLQGRFEDLVRDSQGRIELPAQELSADDPFAQLLSLTNVDSGMFFVIILRSLMLWS